MTKDESKDAVAPADQTLKNVDAVAALTEAYIKFVCLQGCHCSALSCDGGFDCIAVRARYEICHCDREGCEGGVSCQTWKDDSGFEGK